MTSSLSLSIGFSADGAPTSGSGDVSRVQHGNNQVVFGHQVVFGDKDGEPPAEVSLFLESVEYFSVVVVGVRENPVNAAADAAQLGH